MTQNELSRLRLTTLRIRCATYFSEVASTYGATFKGLWKLTVSWAKRKQTKRVVRKKILQSKNSISLEDGVETKNFPDSALGNFLCTSGYKTKTEKNLVFPGLPCP